MLATYNPSKFLELIEAKIIQHPTARDSDKRAKKMACDMLDAFRETAKETEEFPQALKSEANFRKILLDWYETPEAFAEDCTPLTAVEKEYYYFGTSFTKKRKALEKIHLAAVKTAYKWIMDAYRKTTDALTVATHYVRMDRFPNERLTKYYGIVCPDGSWGGWTRNSSHATLLPKLEAENVAAQIRITPKTLGSNELREPDYFASCAKRKCAYFPFNF